jgi:hypothetical protein
MSLSSYSRHAWNVGQELRDMLRDEAYQPLLTRLSSRSVQDLAAFSRRDPLLVERIATAQPAPRRKMLDKLTLEDRFWMLAAAAQMAFEAAAVLEAADLELRPGGSYRAMIGSVQTVLAAPYLSDDYLWPWPSPPPEGVFD